MVSGRTEMNSGVNYKEIALSASRFAVSECVCVRVLKQTKRVDAGVEPYILLCFQQTV